MTEQVAWENKILHAKTLTTLWIMALSLAAAAEVPQPNPAVPRGATEAARYLVKKTSGPIRINGSPNDEAWAKADAAQIDQFPWTEHEFYPETTVKVLHDDTHLYLLFECWEKYIHATHTADLSQVFQDNCVELFVSPSRDLSKPYLNFEFNCLGALLLQRGFEIGGRTNASPETVGRIKRKATFEEPIDRQDESLKVWFLEAAIPLSLITEMADGHSPRPGTVWRANFNKCSTSTKEKHWATWSRVGTPRPHFHKSEFFGELIFE